MSEFSPHRSVPQHPIAFGATRSLPVPANIAVDGLAVAAAMAALASILDIATYQRSADPSSSPTDVDHMVSLDRGIQALYALTLVLAGISFIVWLYRARTNLDGWYAPGLTWARAWAIGGWFLPFANIVIPLIVIGETERASESLAAAVEDRQVNRTGRTIFVLWVVLWNLSGITTLAAVYAAAELADHLNLYTALSYGNAVVVIAAAALAILLVRGVTANQESIRQAVASSQPAIR